VRDTMPSPPGRIEGERLREAALTLLAERRAVVVRAGRQAVAEGARDRDGGALHAGRPCCGAGLARRPSRFTRL
jgi:hypothetical protein